MRYLAHIIQPFANICAFVTNVYSVIITVLTSGNTFMHTNGSHATLDQVTRIEAPDAAHNADAPMHKTHLEVALTIVYENKPSETVVATSYQDLQQAELEAFRLAQEKCFLEDAKMLLLRCGDKTRAEFFQQSSAYRQFLASSYTST